MKRKEILILSICVFLTVLVWIIVDIYRAGNEEKINEKIEVSLIENYQIDEEILKILKDKKE